MEPQLKKILLVDDDPVFLKGMMYTVKQLGFDPIIAGGGKAAAELLKTIKVDAIISDINMPEGNGLQLLNYVKKRSTLPFILMTGLSDLKEAKTALDMGANFFLSKPFKRSELKELLEKCFAPAPEAKIHEPMEKLHIEEFLHADEMTFDIFMKRENQFIKVSSGGEKISSQVLSSYRSSGILSLYIRKSDFIRYMGLEAFCTKPACPDEKKKITDKFKNKFYEVEYLSALNPEAATRAYAVFFNCLDLLCDNIDTFTILKKMTEKDSAPLSICTFTGILAAQVSQYTGQRSLKEFFLIITSSLLSGIGILDTNLSTKGIDASYTMDDKIVYESHPARGAKMLSTIPLPEEVRVIILQHEEKEDGSGFPIGLKGNATHPLAKIVAASHAFIFEFLKSKTGKIQSDVNLMEDFVVNSIQTYDILILEAMLHAFNVSTPPTFVEFQLSRILTGTEA